MPASARELAGRAPQSLVPDMEQYGMLLPVCLLIRPLVRAFTSCSQGPERTPRYMPFMPVITCHMNYLDPPFQFGWPSDCDHFWHHHLTFLCFLRMALKAPNHHSLLQFAKQEMFCSIPLYCWDDAKLYATKRWHGLQGNEVHHLMTL